MRFGRRHRVTPAREPAAPVPEPAAPTPDARPLTREATAPAMPPDFEPEFAALYTQAAPYTMTSVERMYAVWQATRYVLEADITGAIVECGVWRGGSSLMAALAMRDAGDTSRPLFLFDTFQGMPPPGPQDVTISGESAQWWLEQSDDVPGASDVRAYATLEDVQETMSVAAHPDVRYVAGRVEDTVPAQAPQEIALLRLDTDWYESTRHELEHLWPRLCDGGVLIIDDYGHWQGARQATDEYFAGRQVLLQRIDYTGRLVVKRGPVRP